MSERYRFSDLRELLAEGERRKIRRSTCRNRRRFERERVAAKCARRSSPGRPAGKSFNPSPRPTKFPASFSILTIPRRFWLLRSMTVGDFREFLSIIKPPRRDLKFLKWGITLEMKPRCREADEQTRTSCWRRRRFVTSRVVEHHGRARRPRHTPPAQPPVRRRGRNLAGGV